MKLEINLDDYEFGFTEETLASSIRDIVKQEIEDAIKSTVCYEIEKKMQSSMDSVIRRAVDKDWVKVATLLGQLEGISQGT